MSIKVESVSKRFNTFVALENINLDIKKGELVALLGPSGSGKTTLLRIIAGLDIPDAGRVLLEGEDTSNTHVRERQVGFVFQHYALFKHMTVFENVAFGLRVRPRATRPGEAAIHAKVMELLGLVHLEGLHMRYPAQLSGGQRQRVALARALAVEPRVLLLDEPFGALDAKVRKELRRWMRRLHDELHITSVFVTHDQEEAMEVADRVVVMSNGHIEQVGTPEEVYHTPANAFVYDFLGNYNAFEGWKDADGKLHLTEYDVVTAESVGTTQPGGWLRHHPEISGFLSRLVPGLLPEGPQEDLPPRRKITRRGEIGGGMPVTLFARPHEMFIAKEPDGEHEYIAANIVHLNPAGALVKLELERTNGALLQAEIPKSVAASLDIKKHGRIYVRPKQMKVFE